MPRQGIGLQTAIGERPHRVRVQLALTPVSDGDGGYTEGWIDADPPTMFVRLRPATAQDIERARAGTVVSMITHAVSAPYHPQVTTSSRLLYRGLIYHVLGAASTDARRGDTTLLVSEVEPEPTPEPFMWDSEP